MIAPVPVHCFSIIFPNFLTYPMQVPKSPRPPAGGSSLFFVFYVLYYILHRNSHRIVDNVELLWPLCGLLDIGRMVSLFLHLLDNLLSSYE